MRRRSVVLLAVLLMSACSKEDKRHGGATATATAIKSAPSTTKKGDPHLITPQLRAEIQRLASLPLDRRMDVMLQLQCIGRSAGPNGVPPDRRATAMDEAIARSTDPAKNLACRKALEQPPAAH